MKFKPASELGAGGDSDPAAVSTVSWSAGGCSSCPALRVGYGRVVNLSDLACQWKQAGGPLARQTLTLDYLGYRKCAVPNTMCATQSHGVRASL